MTFDDDFVQVEFRCGTQRATCESLGLEWPPPELIKVFDPLEGFVPMRRVSFSQLTDEQRAKCSHVVRGALYRPDTLSEYVPDEVLIP